MIGNDIIDITEAAKSDWRREGYLKKIFTEREKKSILNSDHPNITVLIFWSMKESAYKIYFRNNLIRVFNPVKFECSLTSCSSDQYYGEVVFPGFIYKTFTKVYKEFISTIALGNFEISIQNVLSESIKYSTKNSSLQQKEIYSASLNSFARKNGYPVSELSIEKKYQIPFLISKTHPFRMPISFSHHGQYAAYAIPERISY